MKQNKLTRRAFLGSTAAAAPVFTLLTRQGVGAPSETLNVAGVGCGGQAMHDLGQVSRTANIVALADVDWTRGGKAFQRWPKAAKYKDFRVMLEKEHKNIDAVVVGCPDHNHAVAAMAAMQLGKHVYVEKPMAHSIYETRRLVEAAKQYKVITQMGNQGHSMRGCHKIRGWVEKGVIGDITEVHCWTDRPSWPQGVNRPTDTPPVPDSLDWDLWLGPAADRPYHPAYVPRNWRGWWDFGTCALGDMGCHILDASFYALSLGCPTRVSAEADGVTTETGPKSSIITYEFPKRGSMPPLKLTWYDGGNLPKRPAEVPADGRFGDNDGGQYYVGTKGVITAGTYGTGERVYLKDHPEDYKPPEVEVPRSRGHQRNWVEACISGKPAISHFDYAGALTELVMLGNIAMRVGKPIEWDAKNMKVSNAPEAEPFVQGHFRKGWELG